MMQRFIRVCVLLFSWGLWATIGLLVWIALLVPCIVAFALSALVTIIAGGQIFTGGDLEAVRTIWWPRFKELDEAIMEEDPSDEDRVDLEDVFPLVWSLVLGAIVLAYASCFWIVVLESLTLFPFILGVRGWPPFSTVVAGTLIGSICYPCYVAIQRNSEEDPD